ncbi:hypothetical protein HAX54_041496 [Datura stramonium]|uniref:Uncharacterized protein n=1 Tax=Datura stramonium TaxID=4076 RepID=A0ABS8VUQ6_DATST|nr:hypothetical protein [Datura stramonium]
MDDGVAGLVAMKSEGVLGGSTLGIAFLHDWTKLESAGASAEAIAESDQRWERIEEPGSGVSRVLAGSLKCGSVNGLQSVVTGGEGISPEHPHLTRLWWEDVRGWELLVTGDRCSIRITAAVRPLPQSEACRNGPGGLPSDLLWRCLELYSGSTATKIWPL